MSTTYQPNIESWPEITYDEITHQDKIEEVKTELKYRHAVYRRLVDEHKMTEKTAARRIAVMKAILQDLVDSEPNLFNQS